MRNEVIYDKNGRPDIMVVFNPSELGLPDTLRGRKVKEYAISKYQNTLIDGVPYSLPFMKPAVNISHDEAIRLCESKGEGWHLITNDEWVALGFWSWDNDTMPTGNTASGKSHSHPEQTGTTYEGGCGKTLTGSGPVQWNHDGTAHGVADMCGNIWEHVGGVVKCELYRFLSMGKHPEHDQQQTEQRKVYRFQLNEWNHFHHEFGTQLRTQHSVG